MVNQQLLDYCRQQLSAGITKENIIQAAVTAGWKQQDVQETLASVEEAIPPSEFPAQSNGSSKAWKGALMVIIIVVLVEGAAYVYLNNYLLFAHPTPAQDISMSNTTPQASAVTNATTSVFQASTTPSAESLNHYSNQFYLFDYPADLSIATSSVYSSHEKAPNGLYLYGTSVIHFQTNEPVYFIDASVDSCNWLNHAPIAPEQSVASAKADFYSKRQIPTDTFEEINVGGLIGYRVTYPTIFPDRSGSLEVRLFSKSYSYDLKFEWDRNGDQPTSTSEEMAQKIAEHFADVFMKSFTVHPQ